MNINDCWDIVKRAQRRKAQRALIADLCYVDKAQREKREACLKKQAEDKERTQLAEEAQIRLAEQMQEELDLLKNQLDEQKCTNVELRAANEQMGVVNRELETANGQLKLAKQDSDRAAKSAKRWNVAMLVVAVVSILVGVIGWNVSVKQSVVGVFKAVVQAVGLKG